MEAVVVDAGSKLLKAGFASPDQDPALIMPTKMKRVVEDGEGGDASMIEEVTVDPVVRGFIRDWDSMEDLLRHVLYTDLGWEVGDEGQILFAEPLFTPKAISFSNLYAPEHLIINVKDAERWEGLIENAGSVFLGQWTPESVGDYASGTNHVLPTYGYARMYSGVSLNSFLKYITVQSLTEEGLKNIGPHVAKMAEVEGLEAHKRAVTLRLQEIEAGLPA
ncbi:unnamed protein product [Musa acuminata subsp. burmannicoides]